MFYQMDAKKLHEHKHLKWQKNEHFCLSCEFICEETLKKDIAYAGNVKYFVPRKDLIAKCSSIRKNAALPILRNLIVCKLFVLRTDRLPHLKRMR